MFDASGIVVPVREIFTEHTILSLHIGCRCRVGEGYILRFNQQYIS